MTGLEITAAFGLVTGMIGDILGLVTQFPINVICSVMLAGLAIGIVRKVIKLFRHKG